MTNTDTTDTGPTAAELENRRREICTLFTSKYKGYDDPEVPIELLRELATITSTLRRKNAGPPKTRRPNGVTQPKFTAEDL